MKIFKVLLMIVVMKTLVFAAEPTNEEFNSLSAFKDINAKITDKQLIGKNLDLYIVKGVDGQGKNFSVITDKDGKYLILTNNVFDVNKQAPIKISVNVGLLKDKELFTYGTGKNEYYIFTDPECPYCHRFESKWKNIKENVKFKIFFFNLDFHKNANAMSRWILSANNNDEINERLNAIGKGSTDYKTFKLSNDKISELNKKIEASRALGITLGVQGTPAVFDAKGNSVNWSTLIKN